MTNIVIVDAVRTPIGKRNGGLSTLHPAQVLGTVQKIDAWRGFDLVVGIVVIVVGLVRGGRVTSGAELATALGEAAGMFVLAACLAGLSGALVTVRR